jgi:cardiolipin synthase
LTGRPPITDQKLGVVAAVEQMQIGNLPQKCSQWREGRKMDLVTYAHKNEAPRNREEQNWDPGGHAHLEKSLARPLSVAGHELKVFVESTPLIAAMIADIQTATTRVWLESYLFAGDRAGQALAEALKERAHAGVEVRLMYDAVGSFSTPTALFEEMQAAGVQVHAFHTLGEAFWQLAILRILNRRNHRKLLIVDDRVAYFGGMNIVDQQEAVKVEQAPAKHLLQSAGFRDVHVRLVGPRQADLADNMDRLWRRRQKQPTGRVPRSWRRSLNFSQGEALHFFDSSPGFKHSCAARVFTRLIRRAKQSITLSMAYFIPVGRILRELMRASHRGVRIRVIVPGRSDVDVVQRASRHCYARLLRHGIRIHERQDRMLHGKVMIVDHQWTLVGSCNLDPRSLWINREFFAVIRSRELAAVIRQVCAYERRHSRRVALADCRQRSWWQRLLDWVAWSFRWWL